MQCHRQIPCSPRPWLSRRDGECAFPMDGDGWTVRSCCNPCPPDAAYCIGHQRRLKGPPAIPLEQLEAHLRALGI